MASVSLYLQSVISLLRGYEESKREHGYVQTKCELCDAHFLHSLKPLYFWHPDLYFANIFLNTFFFINVLYKKIYEHMI